jgi:hypothetical protein
VLDDAVDHLRHNVLAAAADYETAERDLSRAYEADKTPASWEPAARTAKRRAAELAIAIDGLADRCTLETGLSLTDIRSQVSALCLWPGSGAPRIGALARVMGVANAYKHQNLSNPALPITSDADVLVIGLGYGLDGWGVGKMGGVEVLVRETSGTSFKFLGDAPVVIAAWFRFLRQHGAVLPAGPYVAFGLQLYP